MTHQELLYLNEELDEALEELESAEDFLNFFEVDYDPSIVQVNRLHILQRFHNFLAQRQAELPATSEARFAFYQELLAQSYQSFVGSSAQQEKVLKIFKRGQPGSGFVSLGSIGGA
ncbi:nitrogenase-stabilizing/protective protein NifW [Marinospirillum sp.]|uniref:nitrogenase-stabilizing/protective protein NifW n=1 Tax=Marinospirillum sp. TaxID=2183934 RepID=UPI003A85D9A0